MSTNFVCVPIEARYHNELVLRQGKPDSVSDMINMIIEDYLDRTKNDGNWSESYFESRGEWESKQEFIEKYGDPDRGYNWQPVFLPNGTQISMTYQDKKYYAEVQHEQINYDGSTFSPSELASVIASNTRRNAWRDLYLKFPNSSEWILADQFRRIKK